MGTCPHPVRKNIATGTLNKNTRNTKDTTKGKNHPHNDDDCHNHHPSDDNIIDVG